MTKLDSAEGSKARTDMKFRLPSPLEAETEDLLRKVIGCALTVHRELSPGLLEQIYSDALTIELEESGLTFERERRMMIEYRGRPLRVQRIDLIVAGQVLVELKAVEQLAPVHQAQFLCYLRASGLRVGLLFNFNSRHLRDSIRRFIL